MRELRAKKPPYRDATKETILSLLLTSDGVGKKEKELALMELALRYYRTGMHEGHVEGYNEGLNMADALAQEAQAKEMQNHCQREEG